MTNASQSARKLVDEWIKAGAPAVKPNPDFNEDIVLSRRQAAHIDAIALNAGRTRAEIVSGILSGSWKQAKKRSNAAFRATVKRVRKEPYPEQDELLAIFEKIDAAEAVGLAEAPTGTGKTLVAAHYALQHSERVVIAEPTVALVHQVAANIRAVLPANGRRSVAVILGMQEFVSVSALEEALPALPARQRDAVHRWITDGGPGPGSDYSPWTVAGLAHALDAKGIEMEIPASLTLASHPCPVSEAAQKAQFETDAGILIVTHAMLARDTVLRRIASRKAADARGIASGRVDAEPGEVLAAMHDQHLERFAYEDEADGRLPAWTRLVVDEAHMLETNFATALTSAISIRSLANALKSLKASGAKGITDAHLKAVGAISDDLTAAGKREIDRTKLLDPSDRTAARFLDSLRDLAAAIPSMRSVPDSEERSLSIVKRAQQALRYFQSSQSQAAARIVWSPALSFPSFEIGSRSVLSDLGYLWARSRSAVLMSGTLYIAGEGGYSDQYMRSRLAIPEKALLPLQPVEAGWARNAITIHIPSESVGPELVPVGPSDDHEWLQRIGAASLPAITHAQAGTLILCTSRALIAGLADDLRKRVRADRVLADNYVRLAEQKARFLAMAEAGKRPVWLATGAAWTGLDLPDHTLSDLIVPRLPYRTQPTLMSDIRASKQTTGTFLGEQAEMLIALRQGIGRLVRTREASGKHLWVIDGRTAGGHRGGTAARKLLLSYPDVQTIDLARKTAA